MSLDNVIGTALIRQCNIHYVFIHCLYPITLMNLLHYTNSTAFIIDNNIDCASDTAWKKQQQLDTTVQPIKFSEPMQSDNFLCLPKKFLAFAVGRRKEPSVEAIWQYGLWVYSVPTYD